MATQTYAVKVGKSVRFSFRANLAEASAPIVYVGDEDATTPFQTADAHHRAANAAKLLIEWGRAQGGEDVGEDESYTVSVQEGE